MGKLHPDVATVIRELRPGYRLSVSRNGAGHLPLLDPKGQPVRLRSGQPVTLPATPKVGGPHAIRRLRAQLIDCGALAKPEEQETIERMKSRGPKLSPPPPVAPLTDEDERRFLEWLGKQQSVPKLPEAVANITWEEYEAMEAAIELVLAKSGPRTLKRYAPFVDFVERVKRQLERKLEATRERVVL